MKTILFMTVGTGVGGSQEGIDSLAHGILYSIKDTNPDYTIFFGSEDSKDTMDSLKKQFFEEFGFNFQDYEFVLLNDVDDFNVCFDKFKEKLEEYEDSIIKIDYTSGTKTMTMTAAISATIYRKDLFLIGGTRKDGIVIKGTESKRTQNLYKIYDKFTLDKARDAFNVNRFETGIKLLNETRDLESKNSFLKLFKLYGAWDKFNHKEAFEIISNDFDGDLNQFCEIENKLKINKKVLGLINNVKDDKLKNFYILADLLNNAIRRSEEGKYDDAIARLYRSLEFIAQIKLKTGYKINTSNIDIEKIKKHKNIKNNHEYINKLAQKKVNNNKITLGCRESFQLLKMLDNPMGHYYYDNENKIGANLSLRNMSILAHGLENRTKSEYEDFKECVFWLAKKLDETIIKKYMVEAKFPNF